MVALRAGHRAAQRSAPVGGDAQPEENFYIQNCNLLIINILQFYPPLVHFSRTFCVTIGLSTVYNRKIQMHTPTKTKCINIGRG